MTASGSVALGEVLNRSMVRDVINGDVAANTKLEIGWVYMDGANGWKQSNGTQDSNNIYWNDRVIDNSGASTSKGDKTGSFYGAGSLVVTKADGAITAFAWVKPTTTAAHHGQTASGNPRSDTLANYIADKKKIVGRYLGHFGETVESGNDPTAAADAEESCIICIERLT